MIDFCLQDSVIGSVVVLPDTFTKVAGISSVELNDGAPAAVTIDLDKKSGDTMGVFLRQGDGFDQVGTRRSVSPSARQYIRMARCCNKTTSLDLFLYRVYIICASPTLSLCSDFSCFLFCFFWGAFYLHLMLNYKLFYVSSYVDRILVYLSRDWKWVLQRKPWACTWGTK